MSRFQYRDPLIGVLDYITEVGALIFPHLLHLCLSSPKRNVRTIPWQSPMMTTFGVLKTLYVLHQSKIQG
jgi:hypothetical protein